MPPAVHGISIVMNIIRYKITRHFFTLSDHFEKKYDMVRYRTNLDVKVMFDYEMY